MLRSISAIVFSMMLGISAFAAEMKAVNPANSNNTATISNDKKCSVPEVLAMAPATVELFHAYLVLDGKTENACWLLNGQMVFIYTFDGVDVLELGIPVMLFQRVETMWTPVPA